MDRRFVLARTLTPGAHFSEFGGWMLAVEVTIGASRVAVECLQSGTGDDQERSIVFFDRDEEVLIEDAEEVSGG